MITISITAARRLISIARIESGSRRWVPGKIFSSETNHVSLIGQSACTPYGGLASAPSQSSRMCDDQARPHASPMTTGRGGSPKCLASQSRTGLTHPVTPTATMVRRTATGTLWVAVRWVGM